MWFIMTNYQNTSIIINLPTEAIIRRAEIYKHPFNHMFMYNYKARTDGRTHRQNET